MTIVSFFQEQLEQESNTTRKMLSRIPSDKFDWKPHEKSMNIRQLSTHIAELPSWIGMVLNTNELDFAASPYKPTEINNTPDLIAYFEKNLQEGKDQIAKGREECLSEIWTLRNGQDVYSAEPKHAVLRMVFSQMIHHRAQLGVFLRLLNVPIPGSYGPSADEPGF